MLRQQSSNSKGLFIYASFGKAVKKLRFIPAERAHAIARKLQGTPGCSVSVL